ncbi:MAG: AEC family transporter [Spirochaetia bacterium]|nr:AEC family transporter [Spirochaetia bacterium]
MELIVNSIIPVFILIALGWGFKRFGMIEEKAEKFINNLAYYLVLPVMIFTAIYRADFAKIVDMRMIGGLALSALLVFCVACLIARFIPQEKRGGFLLPTFRTNIAYIGFPLIMNAYGATALAQMGVITAFITPLHILLSILYLNVTYRGTGQNMGKIGLYIVSDPLVIASALGITFSYLKLSLPVFAVNTLDMTAAMGSPLMLIAVGAGLKIAKIKHDRLLIAASTFIKLILQPALSLLIFTFIWPLTGQDFKVAVMCFAFPSALASYIMVKQYKSDGELTAAIIMMTTLLSIVTMSGWILYLGK